MLTPSLVWAYCMRGSMIFSDQVGDAGQIFRDSPQLAGGAVVPCLLAHADLDWVAALFSEAAWAEVIAALDSRVRGRAQCRESLRLWVAQLELPDSIHPYLHTWGRPIKYPYVRGEWPIETYQTVYARRPGSAEMPSAGRAFSARVIHSLEARGVLMAAITLHAGVASLENHEAPYEEWFEVTEETTATIRAARSKGNRVMPS